jgi:peptidyl-prolyl cis-trans isomerase SurA
MKRINVLRITALAIMSMAFLGASGQSKLDKKVLMTIGDTPVTVKEFCDVYNKNNLKSDVIEKKSVDEYLDLFVNFRMKVMEAYDLKLDTNAKFKKEFEGYRKQLAKPYFTDDHISEELVEEAYQRKQKDIRASHILITCDKHALPSDTLKAYNKAMEIREKALKGEDFGRLAVLYSQDPSAHDVKATEKTPARKGNQGDLGYFTVFDMVYPFESAAYSLSEGEISMPVRSDFGYHLIKVSSITDAMGTIDAAHIFLALPQNASDEDVQAVKEKAENIYKQLVENKGSNWNEMVLKYSDDNGTKNNKGSLSPFSVSRVVPQFVEALKGLKQGEFSKPIRTNYGFHIVKLLSNTGVGTFESEKQGISSRIEKDMRSKKTEEVVIQQIKKDYGFKENVNNLNGFMETVDSTLVRAAFVPAEQVDMNAELFRIGDAKSTVSDFVTYIKSKQSPQRFLSPHTYAYQLYDAFQNQKVLDYADLHLEEKYPDFKTLVQEYNDGILLFDLMEQQVWNKAITDTVGLQEFYDRNASKYMWKDRVEVLYVTVPKKEMLPRVRELLDENLPLDTLKAAFVRDSLNGTYVKKNFFQHGENQYVEETEWKAGVRKEFPSTIDNSTTIVNILQVRKPEIKTLREAKGLVTSDYQVELEEKWMDALHKKYPVQIDEKVLNQVRKRYQ